MREAKCCSANSGRPENDCYTEYTVKNITGTVAESEYKVFQGITLKYINARSGSLKRVDTVHSGRLEINHCRSGKREREIGGKFCFISQGDMSINLDTEASDEHIYPTGEFVGITVTIDPQKAPECLSCFLEEVNVRPSALISKFCEDNKCFIIRSTKQLEHIFSELYTVPEDIKKGYLKVKVLELLLFLSSVDVSTSQTAAHSYVRSQVELARKAAKHISEHIYEKWTIDELAYEFAVSPSQLKKSFSNVYGTSVYSYIRAQKMQSAAEMLRETDRTVLDIASTYGYDNGSKFARAFCDVMGDTPKNYRQKFFIR